MERRLIIDGSLMSLNEYIRICRGNKYAANSVKTAAGALVLSYINIYLKGVRFDKKVQMNFLWVCKDRRQDPDNICFAKKFILDALVKSGVIPNDGWNNIAGFSDSFQIDKEHPRIEIAIREV